MVDAYIYRSHQRHFFGKRSEKKEFSFHINELFLIAFNSASADVFPSSISLRPGERF